MRNDVLKEEISLREQGKEDSGCCKVLVTEISASSGENNNSLVLGSRVEQKSSCLPVEMVLEFFRIQSKSSSGRHEHSLLPYVERTHPIYVVYMRPLRVL